MIDLPKDAEMFVPHRGPMLLLERLVASDGESAIAEAAFPSLSPFVDPDSGIVEPLALLELIAQAYAASKGHQDLSQGKETSKGFLVGISEALFPRQAFAEDRLVVKIRTQESFDNFYIAAGEVFHQDHLLARASLKIWVDRHSKQDERS